MIVLKVRTFTRLGIIELRGCNYPVAHITLDLSIILIFWFNLAKEIFLMLFRIYYANVLIFNKQQFVIKHERPPSSIPLGN